MKKKTRDTRVVTLSRCAWLLSLIGLATVVPSHAADPVMELPVTFTVVNANSTAVVCPSDGLPYEIHGHLVGPRSKLTGTGVDAVTVYLHSIGWGEFYWHFKADPTVDYATRMARLGHVSLVYDQLGYGASGRPPGLKSCYGSEGDTAHQIVAALRSGGYTVDGGASPVFSHVALASHFAGAFMTQPEAYTFADVDALVVTSFSEAAQDYSLTILTAFGAIATQCALGGQQSDGDTGPTGYNFTPISEKTFRKFFYQAKPSVVDAAVGLRHRGPCGEPLSAVTNLVVDRLSLRNITVPVLVVVGDHDVDFTFPTAAANSQAAMFTGSDDVTVQVMKDSGSALALGRTAGDFRTLMSGWLAQRGF